VSTTVNAFGKPLENFYCIKINSKFYSMSKVTLKWKDDVTANGNAVKIANIKATLKSMSKQMFDYVNGAGEVIKYTLGTVVFKDELGVEHTKEGFVIYETSLNQGIEVGGTYLARISRSNNADGSARKPWCTLYSAVAGDALSDDDFAELPVEQEMGI
jgi:hypothetical protein